MDDARTWGIKQKDVVANVCKDDDARGILETTGWVVGVNGAREVSACRAKKERKQEWIAGDKASVIKWKHSCVRVQKETMIIMILVWRAGVCWEIYNFLVALMGAVLNSQSEWVSTTGSAWAGGVVPAGSEFGRCT